MEEKNTASASSLTHEVCQERGAIPAGEGGATKIHEVDFDAFLDDLLRQTIEKGFLRVYLIERGVDEIDAQNTDGFLLQDIGRIAHINVQQELVGRAAGLQLKPETDPSVGVIGSGVVTRGDGINKRKEARMRAARVIQLGAQLRPLIVQHGFEALLGNIARTSAVEIVAHFLIVGRDGFGHGTGGAAYYQEPARDLLSGANFGEGTEGGWIKIQGERFAVAVELFDRRHREAPVGRTSEGQTLPFRNYYCQPPPSARYSCTRLWYSVPRAPASVSSAEKRERWPSKTSR